MSGGCQTALSRVVASGGVAPGLVPWRPMTLVGGGSRLRHSRCTDTMDAETIPPAADPPAAPAGSSSPSPERPSPVRVPTSGAPGWLAALVGGGALIVLGLLLVGVSSWLGTVVALAGIVLVCLVLLRAYRIAWSGDQWRAWDPGSLRREDRDSQAAKRKQ